ncbi:MAG: hypothetical protein IKJ35_05540 [Clostridia bacterium]|nr:hypothetical protein [Clostridia bacterium]
MAKGTNRVVAGDYRGAEVIWNGAELLISGLMFTACKIDKTTVAHHTLVGQTSGLFGTNVGYNVSVDFTNGKRSMLSLDQQYYDLLIRILF